MPRDALGYTKRKMKRLLRSLAALALAVLPASAQVVKLPTSVAPLSAPPAAFSAGATPFSFASPTAYSASAPVLPLRTVLPASLPSAAMPVPVAVVPAAAQTVAFAPRATLESLGSELARAPGAASSLLSAAFDGSSAKDDAVPASAQAFRPLRSIQRLKMGSYNVLNLFQKVGDHTRVEGGGMIRTSNPVDKEEASRAAQAKAILDEDLDVVSLQEVENIKALEDFARDHLGGKYRAFLIEGNDERGIDVAFLVKKDLPLEIEHRTVKGETWQDPTLGGKTVPLFSRDLPSLVIKADGKPLLVLFGAHMKSKRDRPGDPNSNILRRAQAERAAQILKRTEAEFPGVPILAAGDFNGDLAHDESLAPLRGAGMSESLALAGVPEADRVTHTYHPNGGPAQAHQMDALLISTAWKRLVATARVHRYRDAQGRVKPIPKTYAERSKNPSDHFPVVVELNLPALLDAQGRP